MTAKPINYIDADMAQAAQLDHQQQSSIHAGSGTIKGVLPTTVQPS